MSDNPSTPFPVTVEVCDVCRQPWRRHLDFAGVDEDDGSAVPVTLEHCVLALRVANAGPPGPPGPSGPMGLAGRDVTPGVSNIG